MFCLAVANENGLHSFFREKIVSLIKMDPVLITNIVVGTLLFVSEALPFIRSNNYNGILDLLIQTLKRFQKPAPGVAAQTGTPEWTDITNQSSSK
jgi:hypothetical protein